MHTGNVIPEDVNMSVRDSLLRSWIPALLAIALLAACGDGEDEAPKVDTVFKKKESKSLAEHGTAATEEEKKAREEDSASRRKRNEAIIKLTGIMTRIEESKGDAFDLAESIAAVLDHADFAQDHVESLSSYLKHDDVDVRVTTLRVISKIKRAGAKDELAAAMTDEEDRVRAAAMALWRKAKIADLAPAFRALDDFSTDVQLEAVKTVTSGTIGSAGEEVLLTKADALDGPAARVILAWAVAGKEKLAAKLDGLLVRLLDHPDEKTRLEAVRAARDVSAKRYPVVKKLVQILGDDPDAITAGEAHTVLASWAGAAAPAYDAAADDEARYEAGQAWKTWLEGAKGQFQ